MSREHLIEKHRYINVEDGQWLERFRGPFKEKMKGLGIDVQEIRFPGNDDNALCFKGGVADWERFLKHMGYDDPVLVEHASRHWKFEVNPDGYHFPEAVLYVYHKLPMPKDHEYPETFFMGHTPYSPEDPRGLEWLKALQKYEGEDFFAKKFFNEFVSHMKELNAEMKKEFEYLTSDEAVWEAIEANGLQEEETMRA